MNLRPLEIMDTTLRDGEQTSGVAFSPEEKLTIAKLLLSELQVDRIEVASARVSDGEMQGVQKITTWAANHQLLPKVEVLTFVDGGKSLDWITASGAMVQNLLTKGSLNHLTHQLGKTPQQHFADVKQVVEQAHALGIKTNIYLEDWSNGMRNSPAYVADFIAFLSDLKIERIMLPDTLGVLCPSETASFIEQITAKFPSLHFDFHAHNDYDLSVANVIEAVKKGASGIHLTINGMGERAGNAPMASSIAAIKDFLPQIQLKVKEEKLYHISKLIETFSGIRIPENKPIVGDNVFTQTAGIHADGDKKKNLYFNDLLPERFDRQRSYALGKTSGKANIQKNLEALGINLSDKEVAQLTQSIIELGDKKEIITQADLPFLVADILNHKSIEQSTKIISYSLNHAYGLKPSASIKLKHENQTYEANATGDGQYDAFMNALKIIYSNIGLQLPKLTNYSVRIPPGGNTDALCETFISWEINNQKIKTRGLDSDQTISAIKATEKMLNIWSNITQTVKQ